MKNSKRLLAKLLVLCMIFGLLPAAALADGETGTVSNNPYIVSLDVVGSGSVTVVNGTAQTDGTYSVSADTIQLTFRPEAGYELTADNAYYTVGNDVDKHSFALTSVPAQAGSATATTATQAYYTASIPASTFNAKNFAVYANFTAINNGGNTSSGGSGTSSTQQTVSAPSSSGGNTVVTVEVKPVSSGNTSIANITSANMQKAVDSAISTAAKNGTDPVVRVVISTPANATGIRLTLPVTALANLGKVSGASLQISSGVVEMTLDATSVAALAGQATGTVTISATPVTNASLNAAQKAAVKDAKVVDLSIVSNGKTISTFNGGSLVVTMPFTLPSGVSGDQIVVYYLSDKGELEACSTSYAGGKVTFTTSHLSKYVIGTVTTGSDMPFVDVAAGAWYYDAVKWAVDNNITAGVSATSFAPEQSCTRAQMVSFLWRAAGSPKASSGVNPFTDVAAGSWYYDAVLWAVDKGITAGIGDGKFGPEQTVTRGQTVTFLYRYAGQPASANNGTPFVDVPAGEFYTAAVQWAVNNGITAGTTATTFEPLSNCTRAQIVTFLYRDLAK